MWSCRHARPQSPMPPLSPPRECCMWPFKCTYDCSMLKLAWTSTGGADNSSEEASSICEPDIFGQMGFLGAVVCCSLCPFPIQRLSTLKIQHLWRRDTRLILYHQVFFLFGFFSADSLVLFLSIFSFFLMPFLLFHKLFQNGDFS